MPSIDRRIILTKGPPWGFRLYLDNNGVLTISKIRRHSPAEAAKLHAGDQLVSLNGRNVNGLSHAEAVNIIDTTIGRLDILISRFETTSTKVLMFDKVDSKLPDDVKAELDIDLKNIKDLSPEKDEENVFQQTEEDTEYYFVQPEENVNNNFFSEKLEPEPAVVQESEQLEIEAKVPQHFVENEPEIEATRSIPISKLIQDHMEPNDDFTFIPSKKHYADSSFFNDPNNLYPTVEERIELARKVAVSLTAPENKKSRGHSIFERQRQRAQKHTLMNEAALAAPETNVFRSSERYDLENWPQLLDSTPMRDKSPSPVYRLGYSTGAPPPPAPPPPTAAPPPGLTRTVPEFLERAQQFPKAKHNQVAPEVCFDIAAALHSSNSRGAQIFARKKNRAHKWEVGAPNTDSNDTPEPVMASSIGPTTVNIGIGSNSQNRAPPKVMTKVPGAPMAKNKSGHQQFQPVAPQLGPHKSPSHVIRRGSQESPLSTPGSGFINNATPGSGFINNATPGSGFINNATPGSGFNNNATPAGFQGNQVHTSSEVSSTSVNKWKPVKFNMPQKA